MWCKTKCYGWINACRNDFEFNFVSFRFFPKYFFFSHHQKNKRKNKLKNKKRSNRQERKSEKETINDETIKAAEEKSNIFFRIVNICRYPFRICQLQCHYLVFCASNLCCRRLHENQYKTFQQKMVQSIIFLKYILLCAAERCKNIERENNNGAGCACKLNSLQNTHWVFITNIVNYGMLFRLQLHRRRFPSLWLFFTFQSLKISCRGFYCYNRLLKHECSAFFSINAICTFVSIGLDFFLIWYQNIARAHKSVCFFGLSTLKHLTSLHLNDCVYAIYLFFVSFSSFFSIFSPNDIDFNERTVPFHSIHTFRFYELCSAFKKKIVHLLAY